jgi:hypothetical protein
MKQHAEFGVLVLRARAGKRRTDRLGSLDIL